MSHSLFEPYQLGKVSLKNRVVMPPMCMYSAQDGFVSDWHVNHYAQRAQGGVGLIIVEATGVQPNGRITDHCLGLWDDAHIPGMARIVEAAHAQGAKIMIQLNHAGRKSQTTNSRIVAPSALAYSDDYAMPEEMSTEDISALVVAFARAARRALKAGFDGIEIHAAHGYLLNQFMSPLSNKRTDEWAANLEGNKLLAEVTEAVHEQIKQYNPDAALLVRVSAEEYEEKGLHPESTADILAPVKDLLDAVHVSSGANTPVVPPKIYPGYQVDFAKVIKDKLQLPTIAVGLITTGVEAQAILDEDKADMVAIGRALLRDPHWVLNQRWLMGEHPTDIEQYARAYSLRP